MAKIEFPGLEDYRAVINKLQLGAAGICKYAVYDGAAIVADAIRAATPDYPGDTNDLKDVLTLTKMEEENGFIYTKIAFPGYDSRGVPNPVKARVLESGSSTRKKRPFIRPAVNRSKKAALFAMEAAINKKLTETMNEKG